MTVDPDEEVRPVAEIHSFASTVCEGFRTDQ